MPTHQVADDFIRKHNKEFSIKGYSTLKLAEKIKLIQKQIKNLPKVKAEWDNIMKQYATKKLKAGGAGSPAPIMTPVPFSMTKKAPFVMTPAERAGRKAAGGVKVKSTPSKAPYLMTPGERKARKMEKEKKASRRAAFLKT